MSSLLCIVFIATAIILSIHTGNYNWMWLLVIPIIYVNRGDKDDDK